MRRDSTRYEAFRKEALLLKDLHHPGIPVIYDIEEDDAFGYLIEEYLHGDSLETIMGDRSPLSCRTILEYGIQICSVIDYLHRAGPEPILHLDLQPRNLLVCQNVIKLIDFDQASPVSQANRDRKRFGTVGFAAPEQYDFTRELDERTDIYAIGCLLFYLTTGSCPDRNVVQAVLAQKMWSSEAGRIVAACLDPEGDGRYASANQLKADLEALLGETASSLVIAVYGNGAGIGATHLSLALCARLWTKGITNCYEECHPFGRIRRLRGTDHRIEESGSFWFLGCRIRPYYGRQADFLPETCQVVVQDRGALDRMEGSAVSEQPPAVMLLISGGKWWDCPPDEEFIRVFGEQLILLYNFSHEDIHLPRPGSASRVPILRIPLFPDPFRPDHRAQRWLDMLWQQLEDILERRSETGRAIPGTGALKKERAGTIRRGAGSLVPVFPFGRNRR